MWKGTLEENQGSLGGTGGTDDPGREMGWGAAGGLVGGAAAGGWAQAGWGAPPPAAPRAEAVPAPCAAAPDLQLLPAALRMQSR